MTSVIVTDATASNQGWMSLLKLCSVLIICGIQVYFTTSFFNQKNKRGGRGGSSRDINPFAQSVIWGLVKLLKFLKISSFRFSEEHYLRYIFILDWRDVISRTIRSAKFLSLRTQYTADTTSTYWVRFRLFNFRCFLFFADTSF